MSLDFIVQNAQLFFLVFVRILAIVEVAPLISSVGVPQIAKVGLALFTAVAIFPAVQQHGYPIPDAGLEYALLAVGEALLGIATGFFLTMIYSAFVAAGEFFSLQTGFGFTQTIDPLAQVEVPIEGQFINIIAMYVFISVDGFQKLFIVGVTQGLTTARAIDFVLHRDGLLPMVVGSIGVLFKTSLIMSLPVLGTLLLVSIGMGLLGKAAPQMNLLMMGFPVSITVAFAVMFLVAPFLIQSFALVVEKSFDTVRTLLQLVHGGAP